MLRRVACRVAVRPAFEVRLEDPVDDVVVVQRVHDVPEERGARLFRLAGRQRCHGIEDHLIRPFVVAGEHPRGAFGDHSNFAPLCFTTFVHFARSRLRKSRNSAGPLLTGLEPSARMRSLTSGCARIFTSSSCSRETIGAGRFAGPRTPYQPTNSYPGSASATAGTSGITPTRCGVVTARARSLPARTCGAAACMPAKLKS